MSLPILNPNFARVVCSPTGNIALPVGTRQFSLQTRDDKGGTEDTLMLNADPAENLMLNTDVTEFLSLDESGQVVKFSSASDLSSVYHTLEAGSVYESPVGDFPAFTLYFQATLSAVVEVIYYTTSQQTVI